MRNLSSDIKISVSDLWVLSSYAAIEDMGGP